MKLNHLKSRSTPNSRVDTKLHRHRQCNIEQLDTTTFIDKTFVSTFLPLCVFYKTNKATCHMKEMRKNVILFILLLKTHTDVRANSLNTYLNKTVVREMRVLTLLDLKAFLLLCPKVKNKILQNGMFLACSYTQETRNNEKP